MDTYWLCDLRRFIRHVTRSAYRRYPIPAVQSAEDMEQETCARLLAYVRRYQDQWGVRPERSQLENKIRFILKDLARVNHRFGWQIRGTASTGKTLPQVTSYEDAGILVDDL